MPEGGTTSEADPSCGFCRCSGLQVGELGGLRCGEATSDRQPGSGTWPWTSGRPGDGHDGQQPAQPGEIVGFVVYSDRSWAIATAAIIRSATRRPRFLPVLITAAQTRP
jgi:hypothetical protein